MKSKGICGICGGCGEVKRLQWRVFCSMHCAANAAASLATSGSGDFYCPECGELGCNKSHLQEEAS